ncbi:MAG TPA: hypothetical protein VH309_09690 [Elusimicrobiota bacterium]|jgi:hypothetical protein|nr:hypothetical protein [Elusimicrobiota bacterium]
MLPKALLEFVAPMLAIARKQFPRKCPQCLRQYLDFEQYTRETVPTGTTLDYPFNPMGLISWVRCACGNTLTLRYEAMTDREHVRFVAALKKEWEASGLTQEALMSELRDEVRRRAASGE